MKSFAKVMGDQSASECRGETAMVLYQVHKFTCYTDPQVVLAIVASYAVFELNPSTPDRAKVANWEKLKHKQHHMKVLLNSYPMNGYTLGYCP